MAQETFPRRLSAILSADAVGYSRLMRDDEDATVRTITAYRNAMAHMIQQYRGRVVDSPGDNILAEFTSVVDAVNCAVEIQRELAERNAELLEDRKMRFRIGINLGDVIEEGQRIYGDGVNVAARMEALAEAGGICISRMVHGAVESKIGLEYEFIGEHEVKNIDKPIGAYRVLTHPGDAAHRVIKAKRAVGRACRKGLWGLLAVVLVVAGFATWHFYFRAPPIEPASVKKMAYPLPDKPSIAVLPFDNMSGDPKQDYLADGISESIITALSKIPQLFVIARNSSFTYKGKPVKVQKVAEDLGVRYVLEGSVLKSGDKLRVTAQLIDALSGNHIWAEQYDRPLKDLFSLMDAITKNIAVAMEVKLTTGEQARLWHTTNNLQAWGYVVKAFGPFYTYTKVGNAQARQLYLKAVELDPQYAFAWTMLAWTYWIDARFGYCANPKDSIATAIKLAHKSKAMDPKQPTVYALLGFIALIKRNYDEALALGKECLALGPNETDMMVLYAQTLMFAGQPQRAVALCQRALRMHPYAPAYFYLALGYAQMESGNLGKAEPKFQRVLAQVPSTGFNARIARIGLVLIYMQTNSEEKARELVKDILKYYPDWNFQKYSSAVFYRDPSVLEKRAKLLSKAGLPLGPAKPENAELKLPDKPSIAVLPFVNMSDDPKQEYFSDGITEDIITDLSKIAGLVVISRNSSFSYKGKKTKIPVIAKELGVKYVLEGSIRKAGNEVRINAQLIDATLDHHIWADRFDGKYESIFDLQDRITNKIVSALSVNISRPEQKVIADKGTDNLLAYDEYLKGLEHVRKFTPEDYVKAIEYFKKAIAIDPNYSKAYAELAYIYNSSNAGGQRFWDAMLTDFLSARLSTRHYLDLAMKKPSPRSYEVLSRMELFKRDYDRAIDHAKSAVALAPNDADAWEALGFVMVYAGHPVKAIKYYKRSIMLDPIHKSTGGIGRAYFAMEDYEQAVRYLEKGYKDNPEITFNLAFLVAAYAFFGEDEKAKEAYKKFHAGAEVRPNIRQYYYLYPFKDSKVFDRMIEGMRKAGYKAGSSGYYKLQKENRMTGQEIQETILGKTITGADVFGPWTRKMENIKESDVNLFSGRYRGKIWIEGDEICQKYKTFQGRVNDCAYIYKNPQGKRETLSEYLLLTDYWMFPFSIEE